MKYLKRFNEASFDRIEEFVKLANTIINYDESELEEGDEPSNTDILSELGDLCNELTFRSEELQQVINSGRISDPNNFLKIILDETLRDEDEMENETPLVSKPVEKLVEEILDACKLDVDSIKESDPEFIEYIGNMIKEWSNKNN
jgi:hypothetical protein